MRTAEEILIKEFGTDEASLQTAIILNSDVHKIISAINEARKEAIEEVGKKFFYAGFEKCKNDDANCFTAWREEAPNLLSLINELK